MKLKRGPKTHLQLLLITIGAARDNEIEIFLIINLNIYKKNMVGCLLHRGLYLLLTYVYQIVISIFTVTMLLCELQSLFGSFF